MGDGFLGENGVIARRAKPDVAISQTFYEYWGDCHASERVVGGADPYRRNDRKDRRRATASALQRMIGKFGRSGVCGLY